MMIERFIPKRLHEFRHSPAGGVLPVTQGLEILVLNSHPATLKFLSGFKEAANPGVKHFLGKPITVETLLRLLRKALDPA